MLRGIVLIYMFVGTWPFRIGALAGLMHEECYRMSKSLSMWGL